MRISFSLLLTLSAAALLSTGCGGMQRKLGRGINNTMEITRTGELRRTVEQTAMYEGADTAYTTGVLRGVGRTFARSMIGVSEILTFPFPTPTYDAYFFPERYFWDPYQRIKMETFTEDPNYPNSYKPRLFADQVFATDSAVGFSGGDVAPMIMGSRFRIFDY